MSTVSPNLSLPYIQQNQAQKHGTHNEGMRLLDGVVQLSVLSRAQTAPPANPAAGNRYMLPSGATGAWAGFDDSLAHWEENAWRIIPPKEGWVAWDQNGLALLVFSQGQWTEATAADVERLDKLGLNTLADNNIAFGYEKVHLTLGECNFVFTQSEGIYDGAATAFYDLWRVEDGKIAEHWDVVQTIPEEFAHDNGMF